MMNLVMYLVMNLGIELFSHNNDEPSDESRYRAVFTTKHNNDEPSDEPQYRAVFTTKHNNDEPISDSTRLPNFTLSI